MVDLIEESSQAINDLLDVVGRGAVEAVLQLSAQQLTGGRKILSRATRRGSEEVRLELMNIEFCCASAGVSV